MGEAGKIRLLDDKQGMVSDSKMQCNKSKKKIFIVTLFPPFFIVQSATVLAIKSLALVEKYSAMPEMCLKTFDK